MKVKAPGGLKTNIAPGESKKITVSTPTTLRRGKLKKDIRIATNDPEAKTLTLSIQANIIEDLYIRPLSINFGIVKQGSSSEKDLLITNKGKNLISITDIKPKMVKMLTISPSYKFTLAPGQTRKLVLTFIPGSNVSAVYGSVVIKTDIEYLPEKIIRTRAKIVANN